MPLEHVAWTLSLRNDYRLNLLSTKYWRALAGIACKGPRGFHWNFSLRIVSRSGKTPFPPREKGLLRESALTKNVAVELTSGLPQKVVVRVLRRLPNKITVELFWSFFRGNRKNYGFHSSGYVKAWQTDCDDRRKKFPTVEVSSVGGLGFTSL